MCFAMSLAAARSSFPLPLPLPPPYLCPEPAPGLGELLPGLTGEHRL